MNLAICVATMQPEQDGIYPGDIPSVMSNATTDPKVYIKYNTSGSNAGVVGSYEELYKQANENILFYCHDDVEVKEKGWDERIIWEFDDPKVGVCGFGGALNHGSEDIYKTPYRLTQLARSQYLSNTDDAETHGERFTGSRAVAVVDGFAIAVRRNLLERCGGWHPEVWPPHHLYDYVICAQAHRFGYRVHCVGIRCHHHGGRTATSTAYQEWAKTTKWGSDIEMHEKGHRLFYSEFRDVLPWREKP